MTRTVDDTRAVLADLWRPVLLPSFVYSVGAASIVPAQVLTGLHLGLGAAAVSAVVVWLGACSVLGSVVAGYLVHALGERTALGLATIAGSASLAVLLVWLFAGPPGGVVVFVAALSVVELADGVWSLARQSLVAELVAAPARARAMSSYGGAQRLGRVVGVLLASAVTALLDVRAVYAVHIVLAVLALLMVRAWTGTRAGARTGTWTGARTGTWTGARTGIRPAPAGTPARAHRGWPPGLARVFVLVGLGVVALAVVRADRDLLLPLWGADRLHLPAAAITLVIGVSAGFELLLFLPAGVLMDRIGRLPVVLGCLVPMSVGFVAIGLLPGLGGFVVGSALLGIGNGLGAGIVKTLGADLAPAAIRARFLGWWNALANCGDLLAPAVTAGALVVGDLQLVVLLAAGVGLAGAGWMLAWMPRLLPRDG